MKTEQDRHWRKDPPRARASRATSARRLRRLSLATAILALSLAPSVAAAQIGGAAAPLPASATAAVPGIVFSSPMRRAAATWYGPGLYGNGTACGQTLRPRTIGVAHRTLPCGTTVKLSYHGRSLVTRVIDRGPYTRGNDFDLTNGARLALDFEGVGRLRYAVALASTADQD